MEILKRAKGDSGEGVPWNMPEHEVREEMNRRSHKAGYTDRDGQPRTSRKIQDRGYGDSKLSVWPRDENGNLQGD